MTKNIQNAIYSYLAQDRHSSGMTLQEGSFPTYDQIKNSKFVLTKLEKLPEENRDLYFEAALESIISDGILFPVEGYPGFYERAQALEMSLIERSYAKAIEEDDF